MKPAKNLSVTNNKLASVSESASKKGRPSSPLSPKPKEKHGAKGGRDRIEPMVLRSPPTGDSIVRYALPIPSSKTKELLAEDEMVRRIARHLKLVVASLEETYGYTVENGEDVVKPKHEDVSLSVGDDMYSFLICCSQFAVQLEESVKEERNILESLFKWFQRQVNQMEEISKDPNLLEEDVPAPDKAVALSITQIVKQMRRLDELKNCLKQQSKYSFRALLSKPAIKENLPVSVENYEAVQQQIEEFLKAHLTDEILDVSITESQSPPSLIDQLNVMLKIFKKQSDVLERSVCDQGILEAKYKEIQNDFELLSEKKAVLENELQKLKDQERKNMHKKTVKPEKRKDKGKSEGLEGKMSPASQLQFNEEWIQTLKTVETLQIENKVLQERLKQALQEAERSKLQVNYFLNQGMEFLKNEGKTSSTMEMNTDKKNVKHEVKDVKDEVKDTDEDEVKDTDEDEVKDTDEDVNEPPLERETRVSLISNLDGQRTNDIIQEHAQISVQNRRPIEESSEKKTSSPAISDLSQILKSQDKSTLENSNEVPMDKDLLHRSPSENHDKLYPVEPSIRENQDSLSVETSPPGDQTVTAFISPPVVTQEKSKADVSEEKLQRESQNQTYPAARKFEVSSENLPLENKDLSEAQIQTAKQNTSEDENKTFFMTVTPPEDMISASRKQSRTEDHEATGNENFHTYDEQPDKNLGHEHQDSKTEMNVKNQKTPKRERLTTPDEEPVENRILNPQESMSKSEMQEKKLRTSKRERSMDHDEVPVRNVMLEHQDSESKREMQVKKRKTSREEKHNIHDEVPDETLPLKGQDSVPNTQVQLKKQKTSGGGEVNIQDENPMFVHQDSVSKLQMYVKKQITSEEGRQSTFSFETQKKDVSLENLSTEEEVSLSRSQPQIKKPGAVVNENSSDQDLGLMADISPLSRDSKSKGHPEIKKRKIAQIEALDEDMDGSFILEDLESSSGYMDQTSRVDQTLRTKYEVALELPDTAEDLSELKPSVNDLIYYLDLDKVVETDPKQLRDAFGHHLIKNEFKTKPKKIPGVNLEELKSEHTKPPKNLPGSDSEHFIKSEHLTPSKNLLGADSERFRDALEQHFLKGGHLAPSKNLLGTDSEQIRDAMGHHFVKREHLTPSRNLLGTDSEHFRDALGHFLKGVHLTRSKNLSETDSEHFVKSEHLTPSKNLSGTDSEHFRDALVQHFLKGEQLTPSKNLPGTDSEHFRDALVQHFLKGEQLTPSKNLPRTDSEHFRDALVQHFLKGEQLTPSKNLPGTDSEHFRDALVQHFLKGEQLTPSKNLPGTNSEHFKDALVQHFLKGEQLTPSKNLPGTNSEHFKDALVQHFLKGEQLTPSKNLPRTNSEHFKDALVQHFLKGEQLTPSKNLPRTDSEHFRDALIQHFLKGEQLTPSKNLPETDVYHLMDGMGRSIMRDESKTQSKNHQGPRLFVNKDLFTHYQENIVTSHITPSKFQTKSPMDNQGGSSYKIRDMSTQRQEDTFNKDTSQSKFAKVINLSPFNKKVDSEEDISPYVQEPVKLLLKSSKTRPSVAKALPLPSRSKVPSGQPKTIAIRQKSIELPGSVPVVMSPTKSPGSKGLYCMEQFNRSLFVAGETDPKQLRDAFGHHLIKNEFKTKPKKIPGVNLEELKSEHTQPKNLPGAYSEHFRDALGQHFLKNEHLTPSKNLSDKKIFFKPRIDSEYSTDSLAQYFLKGEQLTPSKYLLETDVYHLMDGMGRSIMRDESKTQSKNHQDPRLFVNKDLFTHYQENIITSHITPSKFQTKSPMDNQGESLHKIRDISTQRQEGTFNKNISQSKFPTKVINLSPFNKKADSDEDISPYVLKPVKLLLKSSKTRPSVAKALPLPLRSKVPSGQPKTIAIKQTSIGLPATLPVVMSPSKIPGSKGQPKTIAIRQKSIELPGSVPVVMSPTKSPGSKAAQKPVPHPYFREKKKFLAK